MISRTLFRSALLSLFSFFFAGVTPVFADSSHARIIRLSLVEGDVRFARDFHGDPLADQKAAWEAAELNLPIRQGYVVATDNGRAEVEFENGAMAFLAENTVLEFYDLSLENGAKTTRLVLRQGTASFYVNPAGGDYFSVTGGDFTVEAVDRANFRIDDFDDGGSVNVLKGHVSVLRKDKTTTLVKGQSFSMRANDDSSVSVGRLPDDDDFDRWVSGRVDSVTTATTAARQYVNSPYYTSGLADLYNYGSWYPVAGYGNCWRPYGVGLGWSPFDSGGWFMDPIFGWSFVGHQRWGWLPYHFGGWIFDPVFGWLWSSGGFGFGPILGGPAPWRPVTGVWVRSKPGLLGIVPVHPLDVRGKAPINLGRGVFQVTGGAVAQGVPVNAAVGERWKPIRTVPRNTLSTNLMPSTPPAHVARTVVAASPGAHAITADHSSSIAYDRSEHRFVNANPPAASNEHVAGQTGAGSTPVATGTMRVGGAPATARVSTPAAPAHVTVTPHVITPPPAPRAAESARGQAGGSFGGSGASRYEPSSRSASASSGSSAAHSTSSGAAAHSASTSASGSASASHAASSGHH
jgi:hypothetical protein